MKDKHVPWIILAIVVLVTALFSFATVHAATTVCQIFNGCTGTSTTPGYGKVLIGGLNGEFEYVASSTFGGSGSGSSGDPFTHPGASQSATTSLLIFSGGASSTIFSTSLLTATSSLVIGTTTPFSGTWFSLLVASTSSQFPTAFNIASTGTNGATTSIFSISATGTVKALQLSLINGATSSALFVNGSTTIASTLNANSVLDKGTLVLSATTSPMLAAFDTNGVLVASSTPQVAAIFATSTSISSYFMGQFVIGTTTPFTGTWLSLLDASSTQLPTAFSIASTTTSGATTTLLSLLSSGQLVLGTSTPFAGTEFSFLIASGTAQLPTAFTIASTTTAGGTTTLLSLTTSGQFIQGTTTPFSGAWFSLLVGSTTPQNPIAFAIASTTTSGATTTLFQIMSGGNPRSCGKTLTDGATITADFNQCYNQTVTLGGNRNITFTGTSTWAAIHLELCQDTTGSRTVTWLSQIHWQGSTTPVLTTAAGKCDQLLLWTGSSTNFLNGVFSPFY